MNRLLIPIAGLFLLFAAAGSASAGCDLCGDLTGDGAVNILDITAFVNWYYHYGDPPACPSAADVNCDGAVRINCNYGSFTPWPCDDLEYLINYVFKSGPPPCDMDDDGIPNCDPYP